MEFKAKDVAAFLKGVVIGDENVVVSNVSKIEEGRPGTLAFLANPKHEHYLITTTSLKIMILILTFMKLNVEKLLIV